MGNSVMDILYSLTNQYVFQFAKNNIESLRYYFDSNPNTMGSPLVGQLLDAIKNYDLASLDLPLFQGILARSGKSNQESQTILSEIFKWKSFNKEQIKPVIKTIQDICASVELRKANNLYQDNPTEFIKYVKNLNFQSPDIEILKETKFKDIDINTIIADNATNGGVLSKYDWFNNSFSEGRVEFGQIGIVTAPPGVGKSLFAMSEALNYALQGYKVHYTALGDLSYKDFVVRLGALWSGLTFAEVTANLKQIYDSMCQQIGDNLGITILPAGVLSIEDYVDYLMSKPEYKIACLDYDGNLKRSGSDDSMYDYFGHVYEVLTKLSMDGRLLYVLSQPKVYSYSGLIGLSDLGESSRKQQFADWILTLSKGFEGPNPNNLGIFSLPKNRRGETNIMEYFVRLPNGRFKVIPQEIWKNLKEIPEKRMFQESEIDMMVNNFNVQKQKIYQQLERLNPPKENTRKPQDTPFGRI